MRPVEAVPGHYPGLPWFLDDLRPQGFLGRTLAHRQGARLGVPDDLNRWQLRDILLAMTRTGGTGIGDLLRSEEHTSELQSLMRISYAVFCLKKKKKKIYSQTPISNEQ